MSYGCHKKVLQTGNLQAIEMHYLTVLEARIVNSSISRTGFPLTCQGEPVSLATFSLLRYSLTLGCIALTFTLCVSTFNRPGFYRNSSYAALTGSFLVNLMQPGVTWEEEPPTKNLFHWPIGCLWGTVLMTNVCRSSQPAVDGTISKQMDPSCIFTKS